MTLNFKIKNATTLLAVLSFVVGTLFFSANLQFNNNPLLVICGISYLVLGIIINLVMVCYLLAQLAIDLENQEKNVQNIAVLLLNIPIAILYLSILFWR